MTLTLVIDTETTALVNSKLPADHPSQPYLVQLAVLLLDEVAGIEIAAASLIVKPEGYTIPDGAAKVHGITTEMALRCGVPMRTALSVYSNLRAVADRLVAHNLDFDWLLLEAQFAKLGVKSSLRLPSDRVCTMRASTEMVNLPPTARMIAAGFNKPKPPQLGELVRFLFGEELVGAHDAMVDTRACARCYIELRNRGIFNRELVTP